LDKVITEIIKLHKLVLSSSREIVPLKIFFKLPAIQNFTADRMSLVTPPNSNGWTIPLSGPKGGSETTFFVLTQSQKSLPA
jgi:hypothetical protein